MNKGFVHIYTGNGKGKTTAALGLAVRAAGAGMHVYIGQFIKSMEYHEIPMLRDRFPEITVDLYGIEGCIIGRDPDGLDRKSALSGLEKAENAISSSKYDLIILDEMTIALYFCLISRDQVLHLLDLRQEKSPGTELVITGRYAPDYLLERADLITEMKDVRHYYETQGIEARDGIER